MIRVASGYFGFNCRNGYSGKESKRQSNRHIIFAMANKYKWLPRTDQNNPFIRKRSLASRESAINASLVKPLFVARNLENMISFFPEQPIGLVTGIALTLVT